MINKNKKKSRQDMILEYVEPHSLVCEVGVLEGDFSNWLLENLNPSELHLVDPWIFIDDYGDVNNSAQNEQEKRCKSVINRFKENKNVTVNRKKSTEFLSSIPDDYFDLIYVDGDHRFHSVVLDLLLALQKVKVGGIIVVDDIEDVSSETFPRTDPRVPPVSPWIEVYYALEYFLMGFWIAPNAKVELLQWCSNNVALRRLS